MKQDICASSLRAELMTLGGDVHHAKVSQVCASVARYYGIAQSLKHR